MTTPVLGDDEMTELVDADFPRVDLVGKGANGVPRFLIAKQDGDSTGLLDPAYVRELIAKGEPEPASEPGSSGEQVTVSGSPAAIAKLIHEGSAQFARPADGVAKAKNDTADRKHKAATGAAMSDGSYPIASEADLDKAIRAVGRGGSSHNAIRKHVISRARSLGASSKIPDNWNSDGSLKGDSVSKGDGDTVAKDALGALDLDGITPDAGDLDNGTDGMDPTVPFADPGNLDDLPGDPDDPGSPAWEAIDAATAQKWTAILARAKNALGLLSDREMLEAATVDPDDADNAYDLQDAQCALDFAIGTLAVFAAGEQAETDICTEAMEVSKALAGFDPAALSVVEGLVPVAKAGRVLSGANESALRSAADQIQKVLASLPQAPAADDQVTKEAAMAAETQTAAAPETDVAKAEEASAEAAPASTDAAVSVAAEVAKGDEGMSLPVIAWDKDGQPGMIAPEKVTKAQAGQVAIWTRGGSFVGFVRPGETVPVAKADGDDAPAKPEQVAVYDSEGNLVGVADPADITPLSNVKAPAKNQDDDPAKPADPAAADPADMTPAPAADAGTPADEVAKAGETTAAAVADDGTTARTVLKSVLAEALQEYLGSQDPAEGIAKQADVTGLGTKVEDLLERIAKVEAQPAAPKVFANGATPPPGTLRGQDRGAQQIDVTKARARKAELYSADAPDQARIAKEMSQDAVAALEAMHAGR